MRWLAAETVDTYNSHDFPSFRETNVVFRLFGEEVELQTEVVRLCRYFFCKQSKKIKKNKKREISLIIHFNVRIIIA